MTMQTRDYSGIQNPWLSMSSLPTVAEPNPKFHSLLAKSGRRRTLPLLYIRDGEDVVIVASKGGYPKHPAWFHNLCANPDTTVQIGSERRDVHARVATPAERERLWPKAVAAYGDYARYQERTDREIPLLILERR